MKRCIALRNSCCLVLAACLFSFTPDTDFMAKASQANLAEIAAAKLALSKSSSTDVKRFARQMVSDHSTAQKDLTMLAKTKSVTLPMEPDADHKAMKQTMSALTGTAFDSAYLKAQVEDHQAAVALFTEESSNGTDPETKAFAAKYLPKLKGHLGMIPGQTGDMKMNNGSNMNMDSSAMKMDSVK